MGARMAGTLAEKLFLPAFRRDLIYPPGRVTIRRATPGDRNAIIAGINSICAEGGAFYVTHFMPDAQWDAVLTRPESVPDHLLAVAEVDGCFAGSARLFPGLPHTLFHHVGELGMFVLAPYRGRGLGSGLLRYLMTQAPTIGIEKITLVVFADNHRALHLYRKFGFVEEGCRRQQFKSGGVYVDEVLMAKFLACPPGARLHAYHLGKGDLWRTRMI